MIDVLSIALERRDRLHGEVQKLEEFIRMAEELITFGRSRGGAEPQPVDSDGRTDAQDDGEPEDVFGPVRVNLLRRSVG